MPEGLWKRVAPLLPLLPPPKPRRYRYPGRRPIDDRATLAGIVFVLKTGINCNQRPTAPVGCSRGDLLAAAAGLDRGRRLARSARAAAGPAARPQRAGPIPVRGRQLPHPSPRRGDHVGPSPVDRGGRGSKHHLICDAGGIPLVVSLTGGNRNDVTQLIPLVDAVPPIRGRRGCPRRRPPAGAVHRSRLQPRHLPPAASRSRYHAAHRPPRRGPRLRPGPPAVGGRARLAWLHAFTRLRTRYERRGDIHLGLLQLACDLICYRQLTVVTR